MLNTAHPSASTSRRAARLPLAAAAALLALAGTAQAQGYGTPERGYWGLSAGTTRADAGCGNLYPCDKTDQGYVVRFGRNLTPHMGLELNAGHFGKYERGGGTTTAKGIDAAVVGRIPMDKVTLFAKLGATAGQTRVDTATVSDIGSGNKTGVGVMGGLGVSLDVGSRTALVAEWERRQLPVAGAGHSGFDLTSVGFRVKF